MSDTHPYWSYAPTASQDSLFDAMKEGRRAFALEMALQGNYFEHDPADVLSRAEAFEAYLRGGLDAPGGE